MTRLERGKIERSFAMRYHKPHLLKNLVGCIAAAGCLLIVAASATLA
jgi:hypothetical protein